VSVLGPSGRVSSEIIQILKKENISIDLVPRNCLGSVSALTEHLTKTRCRFVINGAGISQASSYQKMQEVNVDLALRVAEATRNCNAHLFHLSSTASSIQGIDKIKTPYAYSKHEAALYLQEYVKGITVCDLDALIGSNTSSFDLSTLAFGKAPVKLSLSSEQIIQPTSYTAVAQTIFNLIKEVHLGYKAPTKLTCAGHPVSVNHFTSLVKSESSSSEFHLEARISTKHLEKLAHLIQSGSLSPEFLHLSELSQKNPRIFDTKEFEHYHGEAIPNPRDLAKIASQTTLTRTIKEFGKIAMKIPNKTDLLSATYNAWKNTTIALGQRLEDVDHPQG
jgi:dTDP-4-dehydrorhamnose reductase